MSSHTQNKRTLTVREMTVFGMLGAIMFVSKIVMEALPNIHLLGALTMTYTVVYRKKALIPIYIYVFLNGIFSGFSMWWIPYLYVWAILFGATMLIPKNIKRSVACVVYPIICALHGLFFGVLYAPVNALMYGFNFEQTMAWIAAGLSFDVLHCVGNMLMGLLVVPLSEILMRLNKKRYR